MERRGWISLDRAALDDPLLAAAQVRSPLEAWLWLLARADGEGAVIASTRHLALEWEWDDMRVSRWLGKLEERGYLTRQKAGRGRVQTLFIHAPRGTFEAVGEAPHEAPLEALFSSIHAAPHPVDEAPFEAPDEAVGEALMRQSDEEFVGTKNGPGGVHFPPRREAVDRCVELIRVVGLNGIELPEALRVEQEREVRGLLRQYGEEAVEKAIRGAPNVWPFNRDKAFTAGQLAPHFARCLGAGEVTNGNGKHAAGLALLDRLGVTLPETASEKGKARTRLALGWIEANPQETVELLEAVREKDGRFNADQVPARFLLRVLERADADTTRAMEQKVERRQERAQTEFEAWSERVQKRWERNKRQPKGGEAYRLVVEAANHANAAAKAIPTFERMDEPQRKALRRRLLLEKYGELIGDPMPVQ